MKYKYMALLTAIFSTASIMTLEASSTYDLLVGFTQNGGNTGGNDLIVDIGPAGPYYLGQSGLSNGETWNLNSLLAGPNFNLKNVQWGIIGDVLSGEGAGTNILWVTTSGSTPPTIPNDAFFNNGIDTPISTIESYDFGGLANAGQSTTITAGNQNSWSQQTINGTLPAQFVNGYANPNITGTNAQDVLWVVPEKGTPTKLGTFKLSNTGILTFNTISTAAPPTPQIVNVTRLGNTTTIYFTTTNGSFTYSLHFTNTLTGPVTNWPASSTTVTGNGLTNSLSDTTTATNRFYDIQVH